MRACVQACEEVLCFGAGLAPTGLTVNSKYVGETERSLVIKSKMCLQIFYFLCQAERRSAQRLAQRSECIMNISIFMAFGPHTFFFRDLLVSEPTSSMLYLFDAGISANVFQWNDGTVVSLGS